MSSTSSCSYTRFGFSKKSFFDVFKAMHSHTLLVYSGNLINISILRQIRTQAKKDHKEGRRDTENASVEEVRNGTFLTRSDVRFFGSFFPTLRDPKISIPAHLLASILNIVANSYDVVG